MSICFNWLNMYRDSVVYYDNFKSTVQIEMQSLAPFKPVSPDVIDTWSSYLNTMERNKAPETVSRLFFSTKPCVSVHRSLHVSVKFDTANPNKLQIQSMVDALPEWTEEFKFDTFWTRVLEETIGTSIYQWDKYEMVSYSEIM